MVNVNRENVCGEPFQIHVKFSSKESEQIRVKHFSLGHISNSISVLESELMTLQLEAHATNTMYI